MKRKERTRILAQGRPEFRTALAEEILSTYDVYTVTSPAQGLVMASMRESARLSRFYLGEVLVTEAKVQINGTIGIGITTDEDPSAAHELAVIDSAFNADLPEIKGWLPRLQEEDARTDRRLAQEEARILETRVVFDTMDAD